MRLFVIGALLTAAAFSQPADSPTFEVASVRLTPPPEPNARVFFGPPRGGPGTEDPGQITWANANLMGILTLAYDLRTFQVTAPDWFSTQRYDIVAKVSTGATKQQVNVMWQNLLKDRFGLMVHHEPKEFQVQELTVTKGGAKLKETDLGPTPEPFLGNGPIKLDKSGLPDMKGYGAILTIFPDGPRAHFAAKGITMAEFASRLSGGIAGKPILDKTELAGRYDFVVDFTPDLSGVPHPPGAASTTAAEPGTTIASALEKQLGLKLTSVKATLDVIFVDRAEKTPTEN